MLARGLNKQKNELHGTQSSCSQLGIGVGAGVGATVAGIGVGDGVGINVAMGGCVDTMM